MKSFWIHFLKKLLLNRIERTHTLKKLTVSCFIRFLAAILAFSGFSNLILVLGVSWALASCFSSGNEETFNFSMNSYLKERFYWSKPLYKFLRNIYKKQFWCFPSKHFVHTLTLFSNLKKKYGGPCLVPPSGFNKTAITSYKNAFISIILPPFSSVETEGMFSEAGKLVNFLRGDLRLGVIGSTSFWDFLFGFVLGCDATDLSKILVPWKPVIFEVIEGKLFYILKWW